MVGAEEKGPRPSSDRDGRIHRTCRSRSQVNLKFGHLISRRSCAGTVKKCTKKRDARAELLFCSLNQERMRSFSLGNTQCKLVMIAN